MFSVIVIWFPFECRYIDFDYGHVQNLFSSQSGRQILGSSCPRVPPCSPRIWV